MSDDIDGLVLQLNAIARQKQPVRWTDRIPYASSLGVRDRASEARPRSDASDDTAGSAQRSWNDTIMDRRPSAHCA